MASNQELNEAMVRSWMRIIVFPQVAEQNEKHPIRRSKGIPRKKRSTGIFGIPSEGVRGDINPTP